MASSDFNVRAHLQAGHVIPAHPLALTPSRTMDEVHQRALTRYYVTAGAGGMAVGVHTTGFPIHDSTIGLYRPVLELAAETATAALAGDPRPFVLFAFRHPGVEQSVAAVVIFEHRLFGQRRFLGLARHRFQTHADGGLHGRGHRTLDKGTDAEAHMGGLLRLQQVERNLPADDGAAQVHEHQDAIFAQDSLNRLGNRDRIGAEGLVRVVAAADGDNRCSSLDLLVRQRLDGDGQLFAV